MKQETKTYKFQQKLKHGNDQLFRVLLITVITASLAALPVIFDSFVTPKMFVVSLGLIYISLVLVRKRYYELNSFSSLEKILIYLYVIGLTISTFASGIPFQRAFLGQFGRGNGFGYYLLTLLILVVTFGLWKAHHDSLISEFLKRFSWVIAIYAVLQSWGIDIAQIDTTKSRILLTLGNSNFSGGLLSIFFTYNILLISKSKSKKIVDILLITILLYATFLTGAVQGIIIVFLSLICAFNILLTHQFPKITKKLIYLQLFVLIITITLTFFSRGPLFSLINRPTLKVRMEYWKIGLKMLRDNLLFGVGPDSFYDNSAQYMAPGSIELITYTRIDAAHNWFINLAANFGIITLLPILLLFFMILFKGIVFVFSTKDIKPEHLAIIVTYIALIVDSMVSIEQPGLGIWLYFFAGLSISIISLNRYDPAPEKPKFYSSRNFVIGVILIASLSSSTLYAGRIISDYQLRSNIRVVLIGQADSNIGKQLVAKANNLRSEPEYSSKALDVLARIGDAGGLDQVSRESLDYYPESIQSLLMRQEVLRVLNKNQERCEVSKKIISNTPWSLDQIGPMLYCANDMQKLNVLASILERSEPFLLKKINSVSTTHTFEQLTLQTALAYTHLAANRYALFIQKRSLVNNLNLKWSAEIEIGKNMGATLSPSGEKLVQDQQLEILLTNLQKF